MTWQLIAGVIIALILIVLGILLFPVIVYIESSRSGGTVNGRICIHWLIIKLRHSIKDKQTEILLFSKLISLQHNEKGPKSRDTTEPVGSRKIRKTLPVKAMNFVKPLSGLFRDLLATIRFRHLTIDTTYGMDDPGLTGMITGVLHAVKSSSKMGQDIRFTPDFTRSVLDWDMSVSASITPIRIFPPIAGFFANRQVLRSCWEIIRR